MKAEIVTKCEVYLTREERKLLTNMIVWIRALHIQGQMEALPEGIQEMINEIDMNIQTILSYEEGDIFQ